jgi:hypothetical protein
LVSSFVKTAADESAGVTSAALPAIVKNNVEARMRTNCVGMNLIKGDRLTTRIIL